MGEKVGVVEVKEKPENKRRVEGLMNVYLLYTCPLG